MAMGQEHELRTAPTINDEVNFRTPNKPNPSAVPSNLKRTPANLGLADHQLPLASTSRSWKKKGPRNVSEQPTLTQIDFVTVSQNAESGDELDYIGGSHNPPVVIEIDDDDIDDADYPPFSASRKGRARGVRFGPAPQSQRRAANQGEGETKKGRRSGDNTRSHKKGKPAQKDKTLTQMDYVRRYLKIEPDEDVKLEYTYITPKKNGLEAKNVKTHTSDDALAKRSNSPEVSQHKRRKLAPVSHAGGLENHKEENILQPPVTPEKIPRPEIPSSQSPESPEVTFISSSQFRSATRSPRNRVPPAICASYVKEESPSPEHLDGSCKNQESNVLSPNKTTQFGLNASSSAQRPLNGNITLKTAGPPLDHEDHQSRDEYPRLKRWSQRTVVYETDAETDYGDSQNDLPEVQSPFHNNEDEKGDNEPVIRDEDDQSSSSIDSQELPPLPPSEQSIELGFLPSENNLLSDISICYQRPHAATQFPLEPIPTVNTQKMAELFPESNSLQSTATASQGLSSIYSRPPDRQLATQSQTGNQTQSQSQVDNQPPELVPESSPVLGLQDSTSLSHLGPSVRDAIVQVESSQPMDRLQKQSLQAQGSGPRKILSRSQILTSSVMESIPIPAFWMSSQDSIGEPYNLPDT